MFAAIAHLTIRYQNRKKMIRIYNNFVEMDPSNWSETYDMSINVGLGSGTARQTTANIADLMEKQSLIVQGGGLGTLVTQENLYNSASKYAETIGFKDPSIFFNDPSTVEPKEPEPSIEEKQLAALERIEQLKALVKKLEIESHSKEAEEKNASDLNRSALEGRIRMEIERMKLGLENSKIDADVLKAAHQNRTATDIAVMQAISNLDHEDKRERAALELEEKREKSARELEDKRSKTSLDLEDKKVVNINRAKKAKADTKAKAKTASAKMKLTETDDGGVEGEHKGKKVSIKPVGDGFELEIMGG